MKRLVLISVLMAFFGNAFSQEIKTDTTFIVNSNKIQVVDGKNGLKIKVYEMTQDGYVSVNPYYESRYEGSFTNDESESNTYIQLPIVPSFVKKQNVVVKETEDNQKQYKIKYFESAFPGIYYSYSQLYDDSFMFESSAFSQRPNSFEWGMYLFDEEICYNKSRTLGLVTSLGISNTYNFFNNKTVFATDNGTPYIYNFNDGGEIVPEGMSNRTYVDKSYLRYWSLRLPVSLQIQWRLSYKVMALSVGPELEWRFGMRSKAKYDGEKHVVADDINYNPLGVNVLTTLKFQDFILFGRFGLTQMFGSDIKAVPFNVGFGLTL